jgi:DNA-binding NtrC family response regulator
VIEEAQNVAIISADNQWSIRDRVDAGESSVESFRTGKERVIRAFERDYLQKMLDRHEGNITQAAAKNRRAFWELLRKHGVVGPKKLCSRPTVCAADGMTERKK